MKAPTPRNAAAKTVRVTCSGTELVDIDDLTPFQGKFKRLEDADYKKLRAQLIAVGVTAAATVWKHDDKMFLLDGHQRREALSRMKLEGWTVPPIPVNFAECRTEAEAKVKVLALASTYGTVDGDGLRDFAKEAGLDMQSIADSFRFPDLDMDALVRSAGASALSSGRELDQYTKKVDSPAYKPSGEKPELATLTDDAKTTELLKRIQASSVSAADKAFLMRAAQRHIVFDYHAIAEYYCHAPKELQELMEDSALVIIDFNKAIEQGYTILTDKLQGIYAASYTDEAEGKGGDDDEA